MNANWKKKYAQAEDERVGRERDRYVELGIRLACVALNETEGIGAVKKQRAREKIQEYIDNEFNCGAERHSTARRLNVERGIQRMDAAYEAIMNRGRRKEGDQNVDRK